MRSGRCADVLRDTGGIECSVPVWRRAVGTGAPPTGDLTYPEDNLCSAPLLGTTTHSKRPGARHVLAKYLYLYMLSTNLQAVLLRGRQENPTTGATNGYVSRYFQTVLRQVSSKCSV